MRFKPGTTNEEAKAKLAAFAEKQRNAGMNPGPMPGPGLAPRPMPAPPPRMTGGISGGARPPIPVEMQQRLPPGNMPRPMPVPQIQGGTPGQKPSPEFLRRVSEEQRRVQEMRTPIMQRPMGQPMPGGFGGGMPPASQINPQQPNVMGFPDSPVGGGVRQPGMGGPPPLTLDPVRPVGGVGGGGVRQPGMGGAPSPLTVNPVRSVGAGPAFKKGGMVKSKAKAAAPVKKAAGGKVTAKPKVAMKRGGKVMAKGKR